MNSTDGTIDYCKYCIKKDIIMIKKAICPNCGAEGTVGRYCEFCGTKIPAPIVKQTTSNKQENHLIVEDKLTEDILTAALPNTLVNQEDVPTDIFDDIEIKDITKYIIPMYAYLGTFQAPWSCVKLVEETYKVGDETKRRTKRYPMNGIASDSYAYLFPSCDMENIPSKLKSFILTEMLDKGDIIDYAVSRSLTDSEQNCIVKDNDDTKGSVWRNFNGNDLIEKIVNKSIDYQLPSNYEDFSCSYTTSRTKETKVLVPIWVLNYAHKGNTYTFAIDGILQNKVIEHPIDQEYTDNIKDLSETSDSTSLYGILLAIVDAIIGIISFGLLISVLTRSQIDSDGEVAFRLFWADMLFFVFAFCMLKTKGLWHKSKLADSAIEIAQIGHKIDVINNYHDKIIEQNSLGLSAEQLAWVTELHIENFKEANKKLHSIQQPKDINTGKWVRPFVIVAFSICVLVNIVFISGSVHKSNIEKEKRELAIKDSMAKARAEQIELELQKEQNKPKTRPVAPSSSMTDAEIIGYKDACEVTYISTNNTKSIKFDANGQVCEVKNIFYRNESNERTLTYRLSRGKVVSYNSKSTIPGSPYKNYQTHETYEYKKISLTKDEVISIDNDGNKHEKAYIEYDAKGRVSTINLGYNKYHFDYDADNTAIYKTQRVVPILYLIGQFDISSTSGDIHEEDNHGRPTEIISVSRTDTIRINYR